MASFKARKRLTIRVTKYAELIGRMTEFHVHMHVLGGRPMRWPLGGYSHRGVLIVRAALPDRYS